MNCRLNSRKVGIMGIIYGPIRGFWGLGLQRYNIRLIKEYDRSLHSSSSDRTKRGHKDRFGRLV